MTPGREIALRRGLLVVIAVSALTAVLAGLARLGLSLGWGQARAGEHGPLFVLGVFGTVIGLERAVALGKRWSLAAPVLGAVGAAATIAGVAWASWLAVASGVALVLVNVTIVRKQAAAFTWLMLLGSLVLVGGASAWALGRPVFEVVPAWTCFFVLTIAAERLELSRLAPTPRWATRVIVALAVLLALAALVAIFERSIAPRVLGVVVGLVGAWQLRFDLARRTLRRPGLPRFAASGVLLGAGWLVVAGTLLAVAGLPTAGAHYDAVLHSVFVGFVVSMVFAHAPIILPAVARIDVPYHPVLFVALAVLHLGLVARLVGDLAGLSAARTAGGVANAAALGLFLVAVLFARARSSPKSDVSSSSKSR